MLSATAQASFDLRGSPSSRCGRHPTMNHGLCGACLGPDRSGAAALSGSVPRLAVRAGFLALLRPAALRVKAVPVVPHLLTSDAGADDAPSQLQRLNPGLAGPTRRGEGKRFHG